MTIGNPVNNPIPGYGATISAPPGGSLGKFKTWTDTFNQTGQTPDQLGYSDPRWQWDPTLKSLVQSPTFFQQPQIQQQMQSAVQASDSQYQQSHPDFTRAPISPVSVNQAVSQAFSSPGTIQTVNNAQVTQPTGYPPSSNLSQVDPFTSWMQQQGVFPYNQGSMGMNGWSPSTGYYNPSQSGYDPSTIPNYSMDPYP